MTITCTGLPSSVCVVTAIYDNQQKLLLQILVFLKSVFTEVYNQRFPSILAFARGPSNSCLVSCLVYFQTIFPRNQQPITQQEECCVGEIMAYAEVNFDEHICNRLSFLIKTRALDNAFLEFQLIQWPLDLSYNIP